jgi:hypothetical protein
MEMPRGAYRSLAAELVYALKPNIFRKEEA